MASQYDTIGSQYTAVFKNQPASLVEQANFQDAVTPLLKRPDGSGARVLDLACGTGFYSRRLLDWGAASVVGIDLSEGMITAARQDWSAKDKRLQFQVGDAQRLGAVSEGRPFDLVTGVWLLNYAADLDEMTAMFTSIAANLGKGGVFVGVTPHGTDDIDTFAKTVNDFELEKPRHWGVTVDYYERLASGAGWKTEIVGSPTDETEATTIRFRNYHLRKSIYEEAARRGGMKGKLTWHPVRLPDEVVAETGPEVWEMYFTKGLHFGLLEVEK